MSERWTRVKGGKYKIELDGWNLIVERIDSTDDYKYKFQLYENMEGPQSASSLEIRIHCFTGSARIKCNHNGALKQ